MVSASVKCTDTSPCDWVTGITDDDDNAVLYDAGYCGRRTDSTPDRGDVHAHTVILLLLVVVLVLVVAVLVLVVLLVVVILVVSFL